MNYKNILIVTFILLAILTMSAVSASEDADFVLKDSDAISNEYGTIDNGIDDNINEYVLGKESDESGLSVVSNEPIPTRLNANNITAVYNANDGFIVQLTDVNGDPIYDATLVAYFGEFEETVYTDEGGLANVSVRGLKPGNYTPYILFDGDDDYAASDAIVNVEIIKADTSLTATNVTAVYNADDCFFVYLNDCNGYPVYDATLTAIFGEFNETVYTDEVGFANVSVRGLKPGNYTPTVVFEGDDNYNPSNITTNVEVIKADTSLIVTNITAVYNDDDYFLAYLTANNGFPVDDATLIAVFEDFEEIIYTDEIGWANVYVRGLKPGNHTPTVFFKGDDNYNPSNATANIEITKADTEITLDYDGSTVFANLTDLNGKAVYGVNVGFANNGVTYNVTDEYGIARYSTDDLNEGTYTIQAAFFGNDCFNPSKKAIIQIYVSKRPVSLFAEDINVVYKEDAYLTAMVTDMDGNPIEGLKVGFANNGVTYNVTDQDGLAKYSTKDLAEGTYNVKVAFFGDNKYSPSGKVTARIVVSKTATSLESHNVNVLCGDDDYLIATLKDANGTPIDGAKVGFANNGVTYVSTDGNGEAKYSTKNLAEGTYTVKMAYYGNDTYSASNQAIAKIIVGKLKTALNSSDVNVLYGADGYLVATLKDLNGKAIEGAKVGFANNGVTYVSTDKNGEAKYSTKNLAEGTYTVKMAYYGNGTYSASNQAIAKIIVGKLKTALNSSDVNVLYGADDYLVATLKDANGKAIEGAKVGFANNGVTYVSTDKNGEAKYSTKNLAEGTYTVKMAYYGNDTYSASNQAIAKIVVGKLKTTLTSQDVKVQYHADGYLVATLKDANGKAIEGAKVGFANNGVTYVSTDKNGEAKYSTSSLNNGVYTVKMAYYGNDTYQASNQAIAKIVVGTNIAPNLTSDGVTTTYGADDYLVVSLTGQENKPIVGVKILFTVFGKKIVDITDELGHAKISTKGYSPGIYNVVFKFAGNSVYSEATSSTKMTINRS